MSSKRTKSARSRASSSGSQRQRYQRTDRVGVLVHQVVASELERLADPLLDGVAITDVEVDRELSAATVFYDVRNPQDALEVEASLEQHRTRLQRSLGSQVRMRRTPTLRFRLDTSVAAAERIERILDEIHKPHSDSSERVNKATAGKMASKPRRRPPQVHGMVLVDKPAAMTSHDVVAVLRRHFDERRIGHAGTLDPDATGLLVVGVGSGTRLLRFASAADKVYEFSLHLGVETDTLDASGNITVQHPSGRVGAVTSQMVKEAAEKFLGDIMQIPPMVSAIKVGGKRLHELARLGLEIEREPRQVTIKSFETAPTNPIVYRCQIECSAGTYARTLGADLGYALGIGAHISDLRRTRSGDFSVSSAQSLEPLLEQTKRAATGSAQPAQLVLQPLTELVRWMDKVMLTPTEQEKVRNGASLARSRFSGSGPWALLGSDGELVAVHERSAITPPGTPATTPPAAAQSEAPPRPAVVIAS